MTVMSFAAAVAVVWPFKFTAASRQAGLHATSELTSEPTAARAPVPAPAATVAEASRYVGWGSLPQQPRAERPTVAR